MFTINSESAVQPYGTIIDVNEKNISAFIDNVKKTAEIAAVGNTKVGRYKEQTQQSPGELVLFAMKELAENNRLNDKMVEELCDEKISKLFKLHGVTMLYEVESRDDEEKAKTLKDSSGRKAYFDELITIGEKRYCVACQWYDRGMRENLEAFIGEWLVNKKLTRYLGDPVRVMERNGSKAYAIRKEDGRWKLLKGSLIASQEMGSCVPSISRRRQQAIEEGFLDNEYHVRREISFKSDSGISGFVAGGGGKNPGDWKVNGEFFKDDEFLM